VHLVGNIGEPELPALDMIKPSDTVVFELSSFQLWDIEYSPRVAVLTIIEPDHLNVHKDFAEYVAAKSNIVKFQTSDDLVVYRSTDKLASQIAKSSLASKLAYPNDLAPDIDKILRVPGKHNVENAMAAVSAVWQMIQGDQAVIKRALGNFKGLAHHIELVRTLGGVRYYDDSFSSNPSATKVAVQAFQEPLVLIIGGCDKNLNYSSLQRFLTKTKNIKKILLIGQMRHKLAAGLSPGLYEVMDGSFEDTIKHSRSIASSGDVVLLSPGAASFDMFKNFYDRGEQFQAIVRRLR
jgi:UDP-N-acetylmuramoylalanine--D-glutamate ligase